MAWFALGATAVSVGTSLYSASQNKKLANKALDSQQQLIDNLKYQPIDIEKLKAEATQAAISNATQSLALERSLTPDVANTRTELSKQVSNELALGGKLNADTINTVNRAGRVIGSGSGIGSGSTVPLTAGLLGVNAMDLANQRRTAAGQLLASNPLPVTGLDPGQIASAEIANNNTENQFNLSKAGVGSNLINSAAQVGAANTGANVGIASSLANLIGSGISAYQNANAGKGEAISYADYVKNYNPNLGAPAATTSYTPVSTNWSF